MEKEIISDFIIHWRRCWVWMASKKPRRGEFRNMAIGATQIPEFDSVDLVEASFKEQIHISQIKMPSARRSGA